MFSMPINTHQCLLLHGAHAGFFLQGGRDFYPDAIAAAYLFTRVFDNQELLWVFFSNCNVAIQYNKNLCSAVAPLIPRRWMADMR